MIPSQGRWGGIMGDISNFDQYKQLTIEAADLYNKEDYRGALPKFLELAKVNKDNYKIHETLSYIYLKLNRVDHAEREYQIAVKLAARQNGVVRSPMTFEDLVRQAGDFQKTRLEYENLMAQPPTKDGLINSKAAIHLGIHYMSRGDYKKAEEVLTEFKNRLEPVLSGS